MKPLSDCRLYGIVDLGYVEPGNVAAMTRALIDGGCDILQLRAKKSGAQEIENIARQMHRITRDAGIPLIINDHPAIAASIGAEGVHVGQDDDAIAAAREVVGPRMIVGKSTHSLAQAAAAAAEGACYIGFGPLYATGTKPGRPAIGLADIAEAHRRVSIPIFCIGGVNDERLDAVLAAGAQRVVIVSALLLASEVRAAVRQAKARLAV